MCNSILVKKDQSLQNKQQFYWSCKRFDREVATYREHLFGEVKELSYGEKRKIARAPEWHNRKRPVLKRYELQHGNCELRCLIDKWIGVQQSKDVELRFSFDTLGYQFYYNVSILPDRKTRSFSVQQSK
jgi:hypothetical protein